MRDLHLFNFLNPRTIELLETLTPEAFHNVASTTSIMDKREIFPLIGKPFTREKIKSRILQFKGRILSFYIFFNDWKYIEVLVKSVRPLDSTVPYVTNFSCILKAAKPHREQLRFRLQSTDLEYVMVP